MLLVRSYLREIGLNLLLVLGGILLLVALGAAVQASSRSQGAPLWIPALLVPLLVGNVIPYLVPVTLLVAVLLTYGRMAADGEEQAVRAAGIHPLRLLLPALIAGALAALAVYPLSALVLPRIYSTMRELSFRLRFAALENTNPGASELHFQGLHMLWSRRDANGDFRDVIFLHRQEPDFKAYPGDPGRADAAAAEPAAVLRLRAEKARMSVADRQLVLAFEGLRSAGARGAQAWSARSQGESFVRIPLDQLGSRGADERKPEDFTSAELRARIPQLRAAAVAPLDGLNEGQRKRALERAGKAARDVEKSRYTLWQRLSVACAALPLAAVGAMLGWRVRRAGVLPAFAAGTAVVLFVFYPLLYLGEGLQQGGKLDAIPAAWLPVAGLLAVGAWLALVPQRR